MRISNNLPGLYRYPANAPRQLRQAQDDGQEQTRQRSRVPVEVAIEGELLGLSSTPALTALQAQRGITNAAAPGNTVGNNRVQTAINRYVDVGADGKQPAGRLNIVV